MLTFNKIYIITICKNFLKSDTSCGNISPDMKTKRKTKSKFIVVEGGEGTGKSTLIQSAKAWFGDTFVFTREPGGTPFAEVIRDIALKHDLAKSASSETMFGLMWAARHDNLHNFILPLLDCGRNVLSDRFDSATYAYQVHGYGESSLEELFWTTRAHYLSKRQPDLYVILDLDPVIGQQRISGRKGEQNHLDMRDLDFHNRVRSGLLQFANKVPSRIIDVSKPLKDVEKEFIRVIEECINKGDKISS